MSNIRILSVFRIFGGFSLLSMLAFTIEYFFKEHAFDRMHKVKMRALGCWYRWIFKCKLRALSYWYTFVSAYRLILDKNYYDTPTL